MSSRRTSTTVTAALAALVALAGASPAPAQRRAAKPKLTEETLAPTEVFPEDQAKKLGYPNGFDILYTRTETGHVWRLTERSVSWQPTPTPEATPVAAEGEPVPTPTPAPTPDAAAEDAVLPPAADEMHFTQRVGLVRPTFVTLVFTESPAAAKEMAASRFAALADEAARPPNLAVMELEKDVRLGAEGFFYKREFNLGPKSGGVRRGSTLVTAKGSIYLEVDAYWGLKDGVYDAELDVLEERARKVAGFVLALL